MIVNNPTRFLVQNFFFIIKSASDAISQSKIIVTRIDLCVIIIFTTTRSLTGFTNRRNHLES